MNERIASFKEYFPEVFERSKRITDKLLDEFVVINLENDDASSFDTLLPIDPEEELLDDLDDRFGDCFNIETFTTADIRDSSYDRAVRRNFGVSSGSSITPISSGISCILL